MRGATWAIQLPNALLARGRLRCLVFFLFKQPKPLNVKKVKLKLKLLIIGGKTIVLIMDQITQFIISTLPTALKVFIMCLFLSPASEPFCLNLNQFSAPAHVHVKYKIYATKRPRDSDWHSSAWTKQNHFTLNWKLHQAPLISFQKGPPVDKNFSLVVANKKKTLHRDLEPL